MATTTISFAKGGAAAGAAGGGHIGAPIGAGFGVCAGTVISVISTNGIVGGAYANYTEPQKRYLEQLALYRDVIKLIDPKRTPTLPQFEAFNKYTNSLK